MKPTKTNYLKFVVISIFILILQSCSNTQKNKAEHTLQSVIYHQLAAEYRALCYQTYMLSKYVLDEHLSKFKSDKKPAIILDIDETVLDNSPYNAKCILENFTYPEQWTEWCLKASAKPIEGVVEFLQYAANKGVTIFYVSNRKQDVYEATLTNLQKHNFPFAQKENLILRTDEESKEQRRRKIMENYEVIMLFGDNMIDFMNVFEQQPNEKRIELYEKLKNEFGKRFIVLPNSMYGDWEGALYNYDYKLLDIRKQQKRMHSIKGF